MSRISRIMSVATIALVAVVAVSPAASARSNKLDSTLAALWTTLLETPLADNPFGQGSPCIDLGGTVAPFAGGSVFSCTVKPGTKLFVAAFSSECSTFEGNGTTDAELRECARNSDEQVAPAVTLDGRAVQIEEAETPLLHIVLPENDIFEAFGIDLPAGTEGLSVGHGWVALLHPLTPGTHTIEGVFSTGTFTTTIVVQPGL